jgi:hypothetical protein
MPTTHRFRRSGGRDLHCCVTYGTPKKTLNLYWTLRDFGYAARSRTITSPGPTAGANPCHEQETAMLILGIVLIVVALLFPKLAVLFMVGVVLAIVGAILLVVRPGGRRGY